MLPDSYTAVHRYDGAIIQRQRSDDPEPCALRQRDLAIVRDVWRYHFLTTNQIRELWWPGRSVQAARRRLVKLFRAGYLERFRPYSPRGSYEWTYFLSAAGHRLLRDLGVIDPGNRFKPRDVFDYGRAAPRHPAQRLGARLPPTARHRPARVARRTPNHPAPDGTPSPAAPQTTTRPSKGCATHNHAPSSPTPPSRSPTTPAESRGCFLIEYDRTSRTDKNYDKFRRYDTYLTWWWRHTDLAGRAEAPFVLFVCQDDAQRDDFLARADHELTGHHWHPTHTADQHEYIGRRRILFCDERDAHLGQPHARRLPPYPPGHPARRGHDAEVRGCGYRAAPRGWSRERSFPEAGGGEAGCVPVARLPAGGARRVSERVPGL